MNDSLGSNIRFMVECDGWEYATTARFRHRRWRALVLIFAAENCIYQNSACFTHFYRLARHMR